MPLGYQLKSWKGFLLIASCIGPSRHDFVGFPRCARDYRKNKLQAVLATIPSSRGSHIFNCS